MGTSKLKNELKNKFTLIRKSWSTMIGWARFSVHSPAFWVCLALLGLNLILTSGVLVLYKRTVLSFKVVPTVEAKLELRGSQPTKVIIPSIGLEQSVLPASIVNGIWETSTTHPTYLTTSARPNEGSNIVIYGHNYKSIFGPLKKVKVGDEIIVSTQTGSKHTYIVKTILEVKPDQIETVLPTNHEVLTVYTCTGWLDSKRLVLKAEPVDTLSSLTE